MNVTEFFKENGIKIVNNNSDKKNVIVFKLEGDCNDGDYVTRETTFSLDSESDVKNLLQVLQVIREDEEWDVKFCSDDCYYEEDDSLSEEEKELYSDFELTVSFPSDSWGRCHTITDWSFTFYDEFGVAHNLDISA